MDGNWNKWWMWLLAPVILIVVALLRVWDRIKPAKGVKR